MFESIKIPDLLIDYINDKYYKELPETLVAIDNLQKLELNIKAIEFLRVIKFKVLFYASQAFNTYNYLKILRNAKIKYRYKYFLLFLKFLCIPKIRNYYLELKK